MGVKVEGKKFNYWTQKVSVTDKGWFNPYGYQSWMDDLYSIPESSVEKAADELDIKNINSENDVDKILDFLKNQEMIKDDDDDDDDDDKPKNEFDLDDIDIEDSDQPDKVKKYKGPAAKKKYKKKIKGILKGLQGKKPNLAKELKSLLGKIKDGKYKNLPEEFKGTLKDFNYTQGKEKLVKQKKKGLETSSTLMDTISDLEETTAEAIQAKEKKMELEEAQMKADKINRRIQDQQNKVEIRGISRDPKKYGTGFFRKRKNQFKGINV